MNVERQLAYAVEAPSGVILWTTFSISKASCIKKFINYHQSYKRWGYWWEKGYRIIFIGKVK